MAEKTGLLICGHGSRNRGALEEFSSLAKAMRTRFADWPVEYGYLEFARPILHEALDALRDAGCRQIYALPAMLFAAAHVKNDLPSVLNSYARQNPQVSITFGRELAVDTRMVRAAAARVSQALESTHGDSKQTRQESLLLVVGRGASDPDANANVSRICRLLWEGFGFGWAETAYSGVTFPLVAPALEHAVKLGYRRILIFPYFLFTGVLVQRIYRAVDVAAERFPEVEFLKVPYLADHPLVLDTLAERVEEITQGTNVMNCQMCKYREQVLGFEEEIGLAQESHHHHVEGLGIAGECHLCDKICTGACELERAPTPHHHAHHDAHHQHDGHSHHHYPHADHPLGPRSMAGGKPNGADGDD